MPRAALDCAPDFVLPTALAGWAFGSALRSCARPSPSPLPRCPGMLCRSVEVLTREKKTLTEKAAIGQEAEIGRGKDRRPCGRQGERADDRVGGCVEGGWNQAAAEQGGGPNARWRRGMESEGVRGRWSGEKKRRDKDAARGVRGPDGRRMGEKKLCETVTHRSGKRRWWGDGYAS